MNSQEIDKWCQQQGWTEPRQLDDGTWVAFPPCGAIENIIPFRPTSTTIQRPIDWLEMMQEYTILLISAVVVAIFTVCLAPYFFVAKFFNKVERIKTIL
jgi:hypothetical protein